MKRMFVCFALIALLVPTGIAFAGGFNIYEMGARGNALGGAFAATADDASAIFYNPAGLAWQDEGWNLSVNLSPIHPLSSMSRAEGQTALDYPGDPDGETVGGWFFPTGVYGSYRFHEKWTAGFGFFTPFGLGVEWEKPDTFAGRSISTNAQIQGLYFSPVITYRPHETLALSVGAHVVKSSLKLESFRTAAISLGPEPEAANVIAVELEGTSNWTAGFAAAAMYRPNEKISLAVNYKQGITNKFENDDATFKQIETGFAALDATVAGQLAAIGGEGTQGVSGELDYPDLLILGARYDFDERFAVMVDFVNIAWSTFDEVVLEFDEAPDTILEEKYEDVWQIRAGAEYRRNERWSFMAGYVRDNSPQPVGSVSPILPDADRNDYSVGVTWTPDGGAYDLTLGYMLVDFEERSTVEGGEGQSFDGFDASYESVAHIPFIGYNRRF